MDADLNNMYVLQYLKYLSLFIFRFISKLNLKRRNKNNTGNHINCKHGYYYILGDDSLNRNPNVLLDF